MISRIISLIILVPIAAILVLFLVLNREPTTLTLDPFGTMGWLTFSIPLSLLLLASVVLGVILGGAGTYVSQSHHRQKAWKRKYEIDRLKRENDEKEAALKRMREDRVNQATAAAAQGERQGLAAPQPSHAGALPAPRAA